MKRTAVYTFIFCIMLMIASAASAQHVRSNFQAANKYYLSKQYDEAEKLYLLVLQKDRKNIPATYNLGNTYFHLKKYPQALLYYEKAKKLNPEDKAIQQNIAITTNKLLSKIEFSKEFFVTKWVKSKVTSRSSASWAIWMLVCLWSGVLLFVAYLRTIKSTYRKIGSIALLLAAVFSVFSYRTYRNEQQQNFAIIMLENAYMKKAPVESMNAAAALPAGLKVEILDRDKNWYKIRQPNGKTGWIENSWLELI